MRSETRGPRFGGIFKELDLLNGGSEEAEGTAVGEAEAYRVGKDGEGRSRMTGSDSNDLDITEIEVWAVKDRR